MSPASHLLPNSFQTASGRSCDHCKVRAKQTQNNKVSIGADVSGYLKGMMMPNDAYYDYIDRQGNLVYRLLIQETEEQKQKEEEKKRKKEEREKARQLLRSVEASFKIM